MTRKITSYILLGLMTAFLVLLVWQCHIEMAVPTKFEGNKAIDNDGAIRSLILLGAMIMPTFIGAVVAIIAANLLLRNKTHPKVGI
ncbi:MAG TPA: hypothetical protein VFA53_11295 [Xanthobacteraceae bacterium]|nr:hypothetical protein [Xanthobacteraceae bacterium]